MGEPRFTPDAGRVTEIDWKGWGPAAFEEAKRSDRLILLHLTTVWSHWCHEMDRETFADDRVLELIRDRLVAIRVDTDRSPHIQDRYIAGGWPTNAFLTPNGEVLWAGTHLEPREFLRAARTALDAWDDEREELLTEIEHRRKAMETSRSRRTATGIVRKEAADDVMLAIRDSYDPRNGGFGEEPKFPHTEAIELLFAHAERSGDGQLRVMAEHSLDGILAGELLDPVEGGFYRYALRADWTEPRHEKLLEVNADMLAAFSLGAALTGRDDWRAAAESAVAWVDELLTLPDGLWAGSQADDPDYFGADADGRRDREPPYVDGTLYTSTNAAWIAALADAGGRLDRPDWVERAAAALDTLLEEMAAPDDLLFHYRDDAGPARPGLLLDLVQAGRACLAAAAATGERRFVRRAATLADTMERAFWAADGGFADHVADEDALGALRCTERPFHWNAVAARFLTELAWLTDDRGYRALSERTLALLSPVAGRYAVDGAVFARAVDEFFDRPLLVVILGDDGGALRRAGLSAPRADLCVCSLPDGGHVDGMRFDAEGGTRAVVCGRSRSETESPEELTELIRQEA